MVVFAATVILGGDWGRSALLDCTSSFCSSVDIFWVKTGFFGGLNFGILPPVILLNASVNQILSFSLRLD